jgi:hypothetical protein
MTMRARSSYTVYRTVELAIFTLTSILIFDRSDIERRLANLFASRRWARRCGMRSSKMTRKACAAQR